MAWRRERRRNRFSHVLPSSSIAACAGDAGEAVSSPSAAAAAFALDACCCTGAGSVRHGARGWFRSPRGMGLVPFATGHRAGSVRHGAWGPVPFATGHGGRFRSPSAAAAASAPARRPGRGRLAAPSALPGPAPAPSAAARFPRSRPLPGDRPPFAPAHRALSPTSCRLIPEPCPPSADPDGASRCCCSFFVMLFFHGWQSCA